MRFNESTSQSYKGGRIKRILQGDKIWISKLKPSGRTKNLPSGHYTTQITILLYNLDPSFQIRHRGEVMKSVNSETLKQAPAESMIQLVQCVQWLITIPADSYDKNTPFKFVKLDIKDSFCRLAVSNTYSWNLCYVLPQANKVKILKTLR